MDHGSRGPYTNGLIGPKAYPGAMSATAKLTPKGAATRARIVEAAADLILAHGAGGTRLDDIRAVTATSKGQMFHYFPGGKSELVGAIASFQVSACSTPSDRFSTPGYMGGLGGLARRGRRALRLAAALGLPDRRAHRRADRQRAGPGAGTAEHMNRWRSYLEAGLRRMQATGRLRDDSDPEKLALSTFAALHGGLLLTQMMESIEPLEAALDGALTALRTTATTPTA